MTDMHLPTHMPTSNRPHNLGRSLDDDTSRLDAVAKVTGRAKYSRDRYGATCLHVAFVRCPYGAATLDGVDEAAARAVPGVMEIVMTGDKGRYHGHNLGYVVAESIPALRRALRALAPTWSREDVDTSIEDAADPAPEPSDETKTLLTDAANVFEAEYSTPVQTHSSLETHGVMVDHTGDRATVYASTQGTFSVRDGIGSALDLPASDFEVVCEYVGGGFGSKFGPGKEGMIAAEVAARFQRPVRLFCDREEEHLDTGNRPSSRTKVRIAYDDEGTPLGGAIHTWGGVGVGRGGGGVSIPSRRYDLGAIAKTHADVRFNGGAPRAMRAPGHPQGAFAEELMLDEIAARAKVDPLDLRRRLDVEDDRKRMYDLGAELIGWSARRPNGSQPGTIRRGFGVGSASWPRIPARADGEVVIFPDGSVEARSGAQDIGTGLRTVVGVSVASILEIPLERVTAQVGRSSLPSGPGSGGSVTTQNTAPVLMAAAADAKQKLLERVAEIKGGDASDYAIGDGGGTKTLTWDAACALLPPAGVTGRAGPRDGRAYLGEGHSHGVQFVDLHVDIETGVVVVDRVVAFQSCGQVICRKTAESQIIGGVIQGIGYALFEDKQLDRYTGAMVNANLEMYKIPGAQEMPVIEPILWTRGQTGPRGLGEPPVIPTAGAVAGAILNAVGAPVRDLPMTPDRVLAAVAAAKKGGAA